MVTFEGDTNRFQESGTGGILSTPLDVEVVTMPGAIEVTTAGGQVDQRGQVTANATASGGPLAPVTINVSIEGVGSVASSLKSQSRQALSGLGVSLGSLPSTMTPTTPSISGFGSDTIGAGTTSYANSFQSRRFAPLVSPIDLSGIGGLPSVTVTADVVLGFSLGTVEVEIPGEALVVEAPVSDLPCKTIYPDVNANIQEIRSNMTPVGVLERDADEFNSVADRIRSQVPNNLSNADPSDVAGVSESLVNDADSLLSNNDPSSWVSRAQDVSNTISETENMISDVGLDKCQREFSSTVNNFDNRVTTISSKFDKAVDNADFLRNFMDLVSQVSDRIPCPEQFSSIASDIQSLENTVDNLSVDSSTQDIESAVSTAQSLENRIQNSIPSDSPCRRRFEPRVNRLESRAETITSDLGCSDVPLALRNGVNDFEFSASSFKSAPDRRQTSEKASELTERGENLLTNINNRVSNDNPCKSELKSRVSQGLADVRSVSVAPPEPTSCEGKHPQIDTRVDELSSRILTVGSETTEAEFRQISNDADMLIRDINNTIPSSDSRCVRLFTERVKSALDRLEREATTVRVRTGQTGEDGLEGVKNELESLRGQLDKIQQTAEEAR